MQVCQKGSDTINTVTATVQVSNKIVSISFEILYY
jgi:hypothetical protein